MCLIKEEPKNLYYEAFHEINSDLQKGISRFELKSKNDLCIGPGFTVGEYIELLSDFGELSCEGEILRYQPRA